MTVTTADIKQLRELTGAGILDCKKALQETEGDIEKATEVLRKKGLAAASKKASREANEGLVNAQVSQDGATGVMLEVNCETDFVARTDDFQSFVEALTCQLLEQPQLNSVDALLAAPFINNKDNTVSQEIKETIAKLGENITVSRVAQLSLAGQGMLDSYIHIGGRVGVLVDVAGVGADNDQFAELVHDLALHIAAAAPRYISEADIPAEAVAAEKDIFRAQVAEEKKPDNIKERIVEGKLKKWYSEVTLLNQEFVKDTDLTIKKLLQNSSKTLGTEITVQDFARFELGEG